MTGSRRGEGGEFVPGGEEARGRVVRTAGDDGFTPRGGGGVRARE